VCVFDDDALNQALGHQHEMLPLTISDTQPRTA
jgi:hypothetical protein